MREKRTIQRSIFEQYAEHEIGRELEAMSDWLDLHPDLLEWVGIDLRTHPVMATGRKGLTIDSVLRCAILKQYRQLSYDDLAFCLLDSMSCQSFARLTSGWLPKKSSLQSVVSGISDVTWERINQRLLQCACHAKVEKGDMLRIDSTVTDAPIHAPSDSTLLWDSVRVLVRLLEGAAELAGGVTVINYHNHQRVAKKRMHAIRYTRGQDKKARLYRDLIEATRKEFGLSPGSDCRTACCPSAYLPIDYGRLETAGRTLQAIDLYQVIEQTERRVFQGEKVPACEKIVSIFEAHTDIIVKGARDVQYGHKLNLSTGRSGLILDVVIEDGNPADTDRLLPMLDRHISPIW